MEMLIRPVARFIELIINNSLELASEPFGIIGTVILYSLILILLFRSIKWFSFYITKFIANVKFSKTDRIVAKIDRECKELKHDIESNAHMIINNVRNCYLTENQATKLVTMCLKNINYFIISEIKYNKKILRNNLNEKIINDILRRSYDIIKDYLFPFYYDKGRLFDCINDELELLIYQLYFEDIMNILSGDNEAYLEAIFFSLESQKHFFQTKILKKDQGDERI